MPGMSVDPLEHEEEETERVSLDLPKSVADFLRRFAAYRNAMNEAQGRNVRKWTRKSTAEAFIAAQRRQVIANMVDAFERLGDLPEVTPDADEKTREREEREMLAYARAVLASAEKSTKKLPR